MTNPENANVPDDEVLTTPATPGAEALPSTDGEADETDDDDDDEQ